MAEKTLIKAHIIPRSFYWAVQGTAKHVILLAPGQKKQSIIAQAGIFDPGILCSECDGKLGVYDAYGYKTFSKRPRHLVVDRDGMPVGFDLKCADVEKAKKFILSMLWRASVTTHSFFEAVKLGAQYEDRIRELIDSPEPIDDRDFEFIVNRYDDHPYDGGIMPPWRGRYEGIVAWNFYLPYFNFLIRADRRRSTGPFSICRLRPNGQPQCVRMRFAGGPESRYIRKVGEALREQDAKPA